jgi:NADPH2:quinone reductase
MRAIQLSEHGGPEVLQLTEVADPVPGAGEILLEVAAAGVNFRDVYERTGAYPSKVPGIPGGEAAGRVIAVGEGVTGVEIGQTWASPYVRGGYAELAVVRADQAVRVPEGAAPELAAAALLQGMTAHYLACATYEVQPGDTALVHAAAGGTGLLLTQIIKRRGGRVIGTVSTAEKEKLARDAGADEVIRYTEADVTEEARRLTDGAGVHVVYDGVGQSTFDAGLKALRQRGVMVLFGASSGPVPPVDPQRLNAGGSLFLTRPKLNDYTVTTEELRARATDVFDWIAAGELSIHIGGRYPLADAAQAHRDLEGRGTTGKLLLVP